MLFTCTCTPVAGLSCSAWCHCAWDLSFAALAGYVWDETLAVHASTHPTHPSLV